jgi:CheY-like chemotaxis protein
MSKSILIVDDYACIRVQLRSLMEKAGFKVCGEAGNGREAIEQALQLRPDLIVLDLAIPEMNGAEAASVLKQRLPQIPIILFTFHADGLGDDLRRALNVEQVVSKLDGMDAVIESIITLLGSSEPELRLTPETLNASISPSLDTQNPSRR